MKTFHVIDPFFRSIERVKGRLFRPFEPMFYLKLAFIAWLANMGQYGAGFNYKFDQENFNAIRRALTREQAVTEKSPVLQAADRNTNYQKVTFEPSGQRAQTTAQNTADANQNPSAAAADMDEDEPPPPPETVLTPTLSSVSVLLAIPILLIGTALMILILWLASRGRFMFISALTDSSRELSIAEKWRESRAPGNSFFQWMLPAAFGTMLFTAAIGLGFFCILNPILGILQTDPVSAALALSLFLTFCLLLPVIFVLATFLEFGPLLMLRRKITVWPAFKQILALIFSHILPLLKYYIFLIALYLGVGICLLIVMVLTCFLCCLWLAILYLPFLWVLLFLPLLTLKQYFIMEFAKQFGDDYNVYLRDDPAARKELPAGLPKAGTPAE